MLVLPSIFVSCYLNYSLSIKINVNLNSRFYAIQVVVSHHAYSNEGLHGFTPAHRAVAFANVNMVSMSSIHTVVMYT